MFVPRVLFTVERTVSSVHPDLSRLGDTVSSRNWVSTHRRMTVSETMNLHLAHETTTLRPALWAGRIMSAIVVIALLADGAIQLFAPAQIASMLQETGFAIDLARVVGPIILRLRHRLRHSGHRRPRCDPGDRLFGRRGLRPCPHR